MSKRNTIEDCHKLAAERGGKFLSAEYINNGTKYIWKCGVCDYEWPATYRDVQQKHWCPKCKGINNSKRHRLKNGLEDCHRLAKENGGKFLSIKYITSLDYYLWECGDCENQWPATRTAVNQGTWCPKCGGSDRKRID